MGSPGPSGAPSRRLPPAPEKVTLARRFGRSVLDGVAPDVVHTAELLVGELVTNVVIHARTEAEVQAWITDGLIERRGESLDDAMTRLRRHTTTQAQAPLDVFCDELMLKFGADTTDDTAPLALRPTPPT